MAFAALIVVAIGPKTAGGQTTLRGRVLDSETGRPLGGATVSVGRNPPEVVTDSVGRFEARGLRPGDTRVTVRMVGYAPGEFEVRLPGSGVLERTFALDFTGQRLSEIEVQARAIELTPRYAEFERRRGLGLGAYLRWDELAKASHGSVGDALRKVRGVRIQCNQQTFECFAVMARTPDCQPTWFIDGMEAGSFHENTPIRDIYGIEVYRGPGEIPGEFAGSNAACGVIVMWTKSRPFR